MARDVHEDQPVNAVSRMWERLGLSNRLAIATALALSVALTAAVVLAAHLLVLETKERVDTGLENTLVNLSQMAAVAHQSGQPPGAFLNRYEMSPEMLRISFRGVGDTAQNVEMKNPAPPVLEAPARFMHFSRLNDWTLTKPVLADHQKVGDVSMTVSANGVVNDIWRSLRAQILVMASATSVVFLAVWLGLRGNLKPLEMLARGSAALGRGEFTQRLGLTGSREIRTTLKAFNAMADNLQQLVGALNKSERLYASLVEAAPVGIFRTDAQGSMLFANDVLLQMAGVTQDDMSAERWAAAYHPADRERVGKAWIEAMQTRTAAAATTYRYVRPDGSETWAHSRAVPQFDDDGQFEGYVGVVTDITAERALGVKVEQSEQNLNVTLRSIGDAVLVTDAAGRVTMMNPVAEALTGWTEAEASGRPSAEVFRIINEETRATVESPVDRVLKEGVIVGLANHTVLIGKDGTERPIADSGAPIRDIEGGEINGVVLVFRDQSEEYQMQKALRESEQLYSAMAKHVPVGICLTECDGRVYYANQQTLRIIGMTAEELRDSSIEMVVHPEDADRVSQVWRNALTAEGTTRSDAFRYLHRDGEIVWARATITPLPGERDHAPHFICVIADITAEHGQRQRIEQLSRMYSMLSQVNIAIVRCVDEHELLEAVAEAAVDAGGFETATLIKAENNGFTATRYFRPGYPHVEEITAWLAAEKSISAFSATAFSTGTLQISNDCEHDENLADWRKRSAEVGISSAASVPLLRGGNVMAVLALNASTSGFFNADILAQLEQVGRDVSHALDNIEHERQRRYAEAELARNEERLRVGLGITRTGMYDVNYDRQTISLDAVSVQLMNQGENPLELDIDRFLGMLDDDLLAIINPDKLTAELLDGTRSTFSLDLPVKLPDGSIRWLRNYGGLTAERGEHGEPVRLLGVISDISAKRSMEERDRLAATVFDNSSEAILIADGQRRIVMANQSFTRSFGYRHDEILGQSLEALRSDQHDPAFYAEHAKTLEKEGSWQGEIWRKRKNGEEYPALSAVSRVQDAQGRTTNYVIQEIDISAQKEFEQRIRHLAYRDALTSLPNRVLLRDRAEQSIASAHREGSTLALLFLDLDHFKNINDSLGHQVGDSLLKEIARRLTTAVRETDTVGRLGGDEFLVLLPGADADAAAHVAQKLLEECARPVMSGVHSLTVTPSVGISLYPKDGTDFDDLLKTADTAMYRAKEEGRNAYRFYAPEMNAAVFQRMVLESSLRRAIDNNEFVLHFQPKFELRHQTLVGVEALIRWRQPELGMVSPAEFIPIAEESGLIEAIGKWVLEAACRQARSWRDAGLPPLRVAVNFSARQFAARNIAELVTQTLKDTGMSGDGLEMEITESLLAQDMEYTLDALRAVKRLGVHIAVDNFGTGYSSLSYLKRFPIDRLKIDQSFVRDIADDLDDRAIAAAVVTMGHSLGMRVIAEGVETEKQIEILRSMGCDEVQGFHLGRPVPAEEMTLLLREQARWSSRVG